MRKTKIIATLGPGSGEAEAIRELIRLGVNLFRLNMSHAPHDWVREVCPRVRRIAEEEGRTVGLLLDTQGPAIRTGDLATKLELKAGDTFTFVPRGQQSEETHSVDTNYDHLVKDIQEGDVVMVDNGMIQMVVKSRENNQLRCEVLTPGSLGSRRHINLPGIKVNLPPLTKKDFADIDVGLECGVDYVALSFAREAQDVMLLRALLESKGRGETGVIAKIEDQSAVKNIDEIIDAADGVMVARGDLGIEIPYEELPIIQRRIVKKCVRAVKPVIVATHLLESMIANPMPTRAEVTDVANAVFEEADAVMLSGETAVGRYPAQCVRVLDRIAQRIEASGSIAFHERIQTRNDRENVASAAVHLADQTRARGILCFTKRGRMAAICAGLRPRWSPIFAFTPVAATRQRLALHYAVRPFLIDFSADPSETVRRSLAVLLAQGLVEPGAKLVTVTDILSGNEKLSSVQLRVVE